MWNRGAGVPSRRGRARPSVRWSDATRPLDLLECDRPGRVGRDSLLAQEKAPLLPVRSLRVLTAGGRRGLVEPPFLAEMVRPPERPRTDGRRSWLLAREEGLRKVSRVEEIVEKIREIRTEIGARIADVEQEIKNLETERAELEAMLSAAQPRIEARRIA